MSGFIILMAGLFAGWNIEQPAYAKTFQAWALAKYHDFRNKNNKNAD